MGFLIDTLVVLGILGFFLFFVINRLVVKYPGLMEALKPYFGNPVDKKSRSLKAGIERKQQIWTEDRNIM